MAVSHWQPFVFPGWLTAERFHKLGGITCEVASTARCRVPKLFFRAVHQPITPLLRSPRGGTHSLVRLAEIKIKIINISEKWGERATGLKRRKLAAQSRSPSGRRIPSRQSSRVLFTSNSLLYVTCLLFFLAFKLLKDRIL